MTSIFSKEISFGSIGATPYLFDYSALRFSHTSFLLRLELAGLA
jgi:hypothetical protein